MSDSLLTTIRGLSQRRGRERRGLACAEGVRLVEEALAARVAITGVAIAPALEATSRGRALKATLAAAGVRMVEVDDRGLAELADTEHPQGVIAVIEPRRWGLGEIPTDRGAVLVLDGVQDPGNVGTMLRTAFALGGSGVVALPGTADLANPKVLRGSMGAAFRFPAAMAADDAFEDWRRERGLPLWVAALDGAPPPRGAGRGGPVALMVGNEGAGVREEWLGRADRRVTIPLRDGAESLNVAVAAAILLHEVLRDS